jgi:hypothetical protein
MVLTLAILGMLLPLHQRLKARLPAGVLGLLYLGVYAIGRFLLSFYRTDPAVFAGLRQAQLASLLMVVLAVVAIPLLYRRARAARIGTSPSVAVEPEISAVAEVSEEPAVEPETSAVAEVNEEAAVEPEISAIAEPAPATLDRASDKRALRRARRRRTPPPQSTT